MKKRHTAQELIRSTFSDVNSRYFELVNDFFAALTLISILAIVFETVDGLAQYKVVFLFIEYVTVFFFSIEYLARVVAAPKPQKYIFSFFGIVDLLAIVPTYLGLANLTYLKSVRILRMLRFLRMLRLAKLLRMHKIRSDIEEHGHKSLFGVTLQIYALTLVCVVILSATLIWFFEGDRSVFANIPLAMVWSSKVLLGGVPQAMPETILGEVVTIMTRFMGLVLFSLLISIVGGSVKRFLFGSEELE